MLRKSPQGHHSSHKPEPLTSGRDSASEDSAPEAPEEEHRAGQYRLAEGRYEFPRSAASISQRHPGK